MKKIFAVAFVAAALLVPGAAGAGERGVDAALGAASGALVAGPVGLVAGGVIGFTAGPSIAHGLGLHHNHHYNHHYYSHHHYSHSRSAANSGGEKVQ